MFKSSKEEIIVETKTDAVGVFKFDDIFESKGFADFLPSQFVVSQALTIHCDGKEYIGWANTKMSIEKNSESISYP